MLTIARSLLLFSLAVITFFGTVAAQERWSAEKTAQWYADQPWLLGCNFAPSSAINQLEMWQAETFDPITIGRELSWARGIGFTSIRVFLHDIPWRVDRDGFFQRVDQFLEIASNHGLGVAFVLFDGVWDPDPQSGPQRRPRTGVHNSGWVQSPGRMILLDPEKQDALRPYVQDVIGRYKQDPRVHFWDLFNEPDNSNANSYGPLELKNKDELASRLVKQAFVWARQVDPSQPLTVGVWQGPPWNQPDEWNRVHRAALQLSDVISFHDYNNAETLLRRIGELKGYGRPLICTEFMARGNGSTFAAILPVLKQESVGAYCWGLVDGKTQTKFPWPTWQLPILGEPEPWHHDIFHTDGTPYADGEVELIRTISRQ